MNQEKSKNETAPRRRRPGASAPYEVFTENKKEEEKKPKIHKDIKIDELPETKTSKRAKRATASTTVESKQEEKKEVKEKKIEPKEKKTKEPKVKKEKKPKEPKVKEEKKPKTKKSKIITAILIILYLLILGAVIYAGYFLGEKFALLDFKQLDVKDLGIEENVFDEANMNISKKEFDQIKTVAIFGTDNRSTSDENSRSDVNMVVSINPAKKSLKMISVPRDTRVQIRGSFDKMGHAYFYGGPQLAVKTLNQNFGLNITEYATIDFYGVIAAINKLGGINLDITLAERDYINKWTKESYGFSKAKYKTLKEYGKATLLNGEQALAHARNRSIGNDFTRAERQRTVLTAVLNKLSKMNLQQAMDLIDTMLKEVQTNVNIAEYVKIIPQLYASKDEYLSNIVSKQVPATTDLWFETINGLSCVVTNLPKQKTIFKNYIYNM